MTGDPATDQAAQRALADLRDRFTDTLEMRLIEIDQAVQACQQTRNSLCFERLRDLCHRLAGVGASFGFAELGSRARSIDMKISHHIVTDGPDNWKDQVLTDAEDLMIAIEDVLPEQHEKVAFTGKEPGYG